MPVSKKVSPAVFCIFINIKGDKNLQRSSGHLKYPDLRAKLQGPWESFHPSALSSSTTALYSDLRDCGPLLIQISRKEVVVASLSHWSHRLTSLLNSDPSQWLTSIPSISLASLLLTDPGYQQRAVFLTCSREHRNLLSWWHASDNIFFYKNNTELWTEFFRVIQEWIWGGKMEVEGRGGKNRNSPDTFTVRRDRRPSMLVCLGWRLEV